MSDYATLDYRLFQEQQEIAERQRAYEQQQAVNRERERLEAARRREERDRQVRLGNEAARLMRDEALKEIMAAMREDALHLVVHGQDREAREQSRQLVLAIDFMAAKIQERVEQADTITRADNEAFRHE